MDIASGLLLSGLALPLMWRQIPPLTTSVDVYATAVTVAVFPCGRRLADQAPEGPAREIRKYCQKLGLDVQR
jgi:hypothetical protein